MNSFGSRFRITTFGESHGEAIGVIVDGMPAGVKINEDFLQDELDKRKPGGKFATSRKEEDRAHILSGVFDGFSTGAPIAVIIKNANQHSKDYENIKDLFRPGHADFTYFSKYGIRDYRGGGRSSARETAARVAGGALAQMLLSEFAIHVLSGVSAVGEIVGENFDFEFAQNSDIFALDAQKENTQKELILSVKERGDSVGASVVTQIIGAVAGLGEPLYEKLDANLASAMVGINGVKVVEIGSGVRSAREFGSKNNDLMNKNGFLSNNSGGILGGISNGDKIIITTHFKPTPSIFSDQPTINIHGEEVICALRGRHDPCIGIRGSVVATAMARLVMTDALICGASAKLENLKKIYR